MRNPFKDREIYGLIVFNPNREMMVVQRRDTFAFTEFMDTIVDASKNDYYLNKNLTFSLARLMAFLPKMTHRELEFISKTPFEQAWNTYWCYCKYTRDPYPEIKELWGAIQYTASIFKSVSNNNRPPWGFPKGGVSSFDRGPWNTALREFFEETCLKGIISHITRIGKIDNFYIGYTEYTDTPPPIKTIETRAARWIKMDQAPYFFADDGEWGRFNLHIAKQALRFINKKLKIYL